MKETNNENITEKLKTFKNLLLTEAILGSVIVALIIGFVIACRFDERNGNPIILTSSFTSLICVAWFVIAIIIAVKTKGVKAYTGAMKLILTFSIVPALIMICQGISFFTFVILNIITLGHIDLMLFFTIISIIQILAIAWSIALCIWTIKKIN